MEYSMIFLCISKENEIKNEKKERTARLIMLALCLLLLKGHQKVSALGPH
jgi:hypothetical protein